MADYPKWLYREHGEPVLVQSEEEHKALPPGFKDTPAAFLASANDAPEVHQKKGKSKE